MIGLALAGPTTGATGAASAAAGASAAGLGAISSALSVAGPIGMIASAAFQVFGAFQAKKQAEEAARIEAKLTQARYRDKMDEARARITGTRAAYANAGVRGDTGSPLAVMAEAAAAYRREGRLIQEVGATKAAASMAQGRQYAAQGVAQGASSLFSALTDLSVQRF